MITLTNQLGQSFDLISTREDKSTLLRVHGVFAVAKEEPTSFFKDSEINPVLLADGSIIPHYKYNGQAIK